MPRTLLLALALATAGCLGAAQPSMEAPPTPQVREYDIEAVEKDIELYPGKTVTMWTFNGEVPGPLIRATEGDRVVIRFTNHASLPHTLHFHGDHPYDMDGEDHQAVPPGGNFTYDFIAGPAGAYVYHCHVDTPVHIPRGMYGQFIVDPKGGWPTGEADREEFLVFANWNPNRNVTSETTLINGKAFPATEPLRAEVGERVRIFASSLSTEPVAMHLHGRPAREVWPDDHPIDVVPLASGETRVLDYTPTTPGAWMLHDHYEEHLTNDGAYPGGALTAFEVGQSYWGRFYEIMGLPTPGAPRAGHGGHGPHAPAAGAPPAEIPADAVRVEVADYRFGPVEIAVPAGTTVAWENRGAAPHTVTSSDGSGALDSGTLQPGATYAFTFEKPGRYEYRCLPHSAKDGSGAYAGMVGTVVVT